MKEDKKKKKKFRTLLHTHSYVQANLGLLHDCGALVSEPQHLHDSLIAAC